MIIWTQIAWKITNSKKLVWFERVYGYTKVKDLSVSWSFGNQGVNPLKTAYRWVKMNISENSLVMWIQIMKSLSGSFHIRFCSIGSKTINCLHTTYSHLINPGLRDRGFSFWESFLLFPLIAVFCILLILLLSVIFFGRREGQQWRDYKTPKLA